MAKRRSNETTHTSLSGQRSVWIGRKPKGEQHTHSFKAFVAEARHSKEGQAHLAQHHRGYKPGGKLSEPLSQEAD